MGEAEAKLFTIVIVALCVVGWLVALVYVGKRKWNYSFGTIRAIRGVTALVCAMVAVFAIGLSDMNEPVRWLDQPTAERTPALIFPLIASDTTEESLRAMAEERELYAIASGQTEGLYYVVVDPQYLSYRENAGVILQVEFSCETGAFSSAELTIRTEQGTARCVCSVEDGGAMAYKTTVKTPWYALGYTEIADDAQNALRLAETAVYPDAA